MLGSYNWVVESFSACLASRSSWHPDTRRGGATAAAGLEEKNCFHLPSFCYLDLWPKVPGWPFPPIFAKLFLKCYLSNSPIGVINPNQTMGGGGGGGDTHFFVIIPPPASKVAKLRKSWKSWWAEDGDSDTFFFILLKNFGSIFQTRGRGILVHHQPL